LPGLRCRKTEKGWTESETLAENLVILEGIRASTHAVPEKVEAVMASPKQKTAARKNIKKAAAAAKRKKTIAHLPKSTRTALGKQAAKVAKQKRRNSR
jgi:hypothetical protein